MTIDCLLNLIIPVITLIAVYHRIFHRSRQPGSPAPLLLIADTRQKLTDSRFIIVSRPLILFIPVVIKLKPGFQEN
ncbi:hypothetical protein CRX48_11190 [Morganella morganii]|nr:hypothetical protein CRX48_11190 [Morganella morganii]RAX26135.1 hypothetical protein DQ401_13230 [Morganella morganii]RDC67969.1 hypothetical protein DVJ80_12760 [Morganella morganii]